MENPPSEIEGNTPLDLGEFPQWIRRVGASPF